VERCDPDRVGEGRQTPSGRYSTERSPLHVASELVNVSRGIALATVPKSLTMALMEIKPRMFMERHAPGDCSPDSKIGLSWFTHWPKVSHTLSLTGFEEHETV